MIGFDKSQPMSEMTVPDRSIWADSAPVPVQREEVMWGTRTGTWGGMSLRSQRDWEHLSRAIRIPVCPLQGAPPVKAPLCLEFALQKGVFLLRWKGR